MNTILAFGLVSMLFAGTTAAQSSSCTGEIMTLAPCLSYITGNASAPPSSCCAQLDSVVKTQARCLCAVLGGGAPMFGISINQTQALALPGKCKVQTPPLSKCNATGPTKAHVTTPVTPAVPSAPAVHKVHSGKGSNAVPAAASSEGSSYESTRSIKFSTLLIVLSVSLFDL